MVMGPRSSKTTLSPECCGNSNSSRVVPAAKTVAFERVRPENWVVTEAPSTSPSKSITVTVSADAIVPKPITSSNANTLVTSIVSPELTVWRVKQEGDPEGATETQKGGRTDGPKAISDRTICQLFPHFGANHRELLGFPQ